MRLYAVRDCGLLSCPPTPKFERGRMLELPLKPLLYIAFVTAWCSLFSVILLFNLLPCFCLPCVWVGKLFGWFWSCVGIVRPANVLDYEALAYVIPFINVSTKTIIFFKIRSPNILRCNKLGFSPSIKSSISSRKGSLSANK